MGEFIAYHLNQGYPVSVFERWPRFRNTLLKYWG